MSSKRRIRRKQCEGKVRHSSKENAYAAKRNTKTNVPKGMMHVYKCKFCKGWHIGHGSGSSFFLI